MEANHAYLTPASSRLGLQWTARRVYQTIAWTMVTCCTSLVVTTSSYALGYLQLAYKSKIAAEMALFPLRGGVPLRERSLQPTPCLEAQMFYCPDAAIEDTSAVI